MIIAAIIAKVLTLVEWFLDYFVTVNMTATNVALPNGYFGPAASECYNVPQYTTTITACGKEFAQTLAGLTDALLQLFAGLIPGLTAKEAV